MVEIFYRILSLDPAEGTVEVRYWSDQTSEVEARTEPMDRNDPPLRCRTDVTYNIDPAISPDDLHDMIMAGAPVAWLELKAKIKNPAVDTSLAQLAHLVGHKRGADTPREVPLPKLPPRLDKHSDLPAWRKRLLFPQDAEIDISECLDGVTQPPEPVTTTVHLYRRTTKTNDGPWGYPSAFKMDETERVLMPFLQRLHTDVPGILNPSTVYFESSKVFIRKWTVDNIATALAVIRFMADDNIPEAKAMRDLSKAYHARRATTYTHEWALTREP